LFKEVGEPIETIFRRWVAWARPVQRQRSGHDAVRRSEGIQRCKYELSSSWSQSCSVM
jgi:hypothetical protein